LADGEPRANLDSTSSLQLGDDHRRETSSLNSSTSSRAPRRHTYLFAGVGSGDATAQTGGVLNRGSHSPVDGDLNLCLQWRVGG